MANFILKKQDDSYKDYVNSKINEYNSNGKKNIVYFVDCYHPVIDGVIMVVDNYARRMAKEFNMILVVPKHKGLISFNEDFLVIGAKSRFLKFLNYDLAFPKLDRFLKQSLKKLRIDLVHVHSVFTMGHFAKKLAKKENVPFISTMHSQYKQDFERYVKSKLLVKILMKYVMSVFNASDELWAMHNGTAKVIRSYGYNGDIYFMPNATEFISPENFDELKKEINDKYNLSPNLPVFLFVGRLIEQKNITFLAEALAILNEKGLDFKAFFVGNGPDEENLKKKIESLGIENKVILTGRIDDRSELAKYYARSDLFLFPSLYDNASLVQIEASALNTPPVMIKGAITAETVTDNVNGYLSEANPHSYADVVYNAIQNKTELDEISKNAKRDLYYTWDMLAERLRERYNHIINNK